MEVSFFKHLLPTFSELKSQLEHIKKILENNSNSTDCSLIVLPNYLLEYAMLRTSPDETSLLINNEIRKLQQEFNSYIEMAYITSQILSNENKYIERIYPDLINHKLNIEDLEKLKKEIAYTELNDDTVITIDNMYNIALYIFLINKKLKKEGSESLISLNFFYTEDLFYKTINLISNNENPNEYIQIYFKNAFTYLNKVCELIKSFLMLISAHYKKIGEVCKYEKNKNKKRDFESFFNLSFSGLINYSESEPLTNKNYERKYEIASLKDFIYKIYTIYYKYRKTSELKIFLKQSSFYSFHLHRLLYIWVLKKDMDLIKDYICISDENYIWLYELAIDCIITSFISIYNKENSILLKEKISLFLLPGYNIDWEKELCEKDLENLIYFYPDQFKNYSEILRDIAQLMFNLGDNFSNYTTVSRKKIEDKEGLISYGIKLIEENLEPSLFVELLKVKKYELLNEYRKRLLLISEISRIPLYHDLKPAQFKKRINKYIEL